MSYKQGCIIVATRYITISRVHSCMYVRSYTPLACICIESHCYSKFTAIEDLEKCIAKITRQCICMCTLCIIFACVCLYFLL